MKSAVLKFLAVGGIAVAAYPVISTFGPARNVSPPLPEIIRPNPSTEMTSGRPSSQSETLMALTVPPETNPQTANSVLIKPNPSGHFIAKTSVNGVPIEMMFDTGASIVALSFEDAVRIGFRLNSNDFRNKIQTANGIANAASVIIDEIRVDTIVMNDIPAMVLPPGKLETSLMGRSFWGRLKMGFSYAAGNLILKN